MTAVNQYVQVEGYPDWGPSFRTQNTAGVNSVGQGDSGGPTVIYDSARGFLAAGVISSISNGVTSGCQGFQYDGRLCSTLANHIQIPNIIAYYNLTIKTS